MALITDRHARYRRRGAAVVEFALVLPFLAFILIVTVDFSRIYYASQIVNNCARNGAIYGCDNPANSVDTAGIQTAALSDAPDLSTVPTVSSTTGTDSSGSPYVEVTVTYPFTTLTRFPGIASSVSLSRKVRMRVSQTVPTFLP